MPRKCQICNNFGHTTVTLQFDVEPSTWTATTDFAMESCFIKPLNLVHSVGGGILGFTVLQPSVV
jgi:hypothetical protein